MIRPIALKEDSHFYHSIIYDHALHRLSIFTIPPLIALSVYSGRRRSLPGVLPFTIACPFAAAWANIVGEFEKVQVSGYLFLRNSQQGHSQRSIKL